MNFDEFLEFLEFLQSADKIWLIKSQERKSTRKGRHYDIEVKGKMHGFFVGHLLSDPNKIIIEKEIL